MKKLALFAAFLGGCSWSTFDDLGDTTWVDSVGGASGVSPSEFVGLAAPGVTTKNAQFVALGRTADSVGEYDYDPDGKRASAGTEISGNATDFGPFLPGVSIAGDPYDNVVGVTAVTGAGNDGDTKVVSFSGDDISAIVQQDDFNSNGATPLDGPIQATGLVYARTDDDGVGTTTTDVALARGAQIALISNALDSTATLAACYGATSNDVVLSIASGHFNGNAQTDELVAVVNNATGTAPEAVVFNGGAVTTTWASDTTALHTCFDDTSGNAELHAILRIPGPADPNWGKTIAVGDFDGDGDPDIAIGSPGSEKVTAYLNNGIGYTEVDVLPPSTASGFGTALASADLDGDGHDDLIVGAPQTDVDGVNQAGTTYVYSFDGTNFTQQMALHDAQPESEQKFGLSLAIAPWTMGGQRMLVVGADHELFAYFRTSMYPDVRGR